MKFEKFGKEKLKELFSDACDPCISGYPECGGDREKAKSWSCPKFYNGLFTVVIEQ